MTILPEQLEYCTQPLHEFQIAFCCCQRYHPKKMDRLAIENQLLGQRLIALDDRGYEQNRVQNSTGKQWRGRTAIRNGVTGADPGPLVVRKMGQPLQSLEVFLVRL